MFVNWDVKVCRGVYISKLWLNISAVHGYLKPLLLCQIVMRLFQTNLFTDKGDPCKQLQQATNWRSGRGVGKNAYISPQSRACHFAIAVWERQACTIISNLAPYCDFTVWAIMGIRMVIYANITCLFHRCLGLMCYYVMSYHMYSKQCRFMRPFFVK